MARTYFDKKGELFKVLTIKKMEKIDGNWTPLEQEMVDVQGKTSSLLLIKQTNFKVNLEDSMFERTYLLQERGG